MKPLCNALRSHVVALFWLGACSVVSVPILATETTPGGKTTLANESSTLDETLTRLIDEIWDAEIESSPMLATDIGDPRGQDRLRDASPRALESTTERLKSFLDRLNAIETEKLSDARRLEWELVTRRLRNQLADIRFGLHEMPISNRAGFHIDLPELPKLMNPTTAAARENYASRLRDIARLTEEEIAWMERGLQSGRTPPKIIMRDAADNAAAQIVDDPTKSIFWTDLPGVDELNTDESNTDQANTKDANSKGADSGDTSWQAIRAAIADSVVPSYRRLAKFLRDTYVPGCRESIGCDSLPRGAALYRDRIERFTTLPMTAEELHQIGIEENQRIGEAMREVVRQTGFEGSLEDFKTFLRNDPRFYAETPEELLRHVALILKRADGELPKLFGHLPRIPYGIRQIPDYIAPQTTSAYYYPPSTDGTRAGFYYVNTYNLRSRPLYQLESLSLHEAVPGHHLQLALQAEIEGLHPIVRQSRFTAFVEGWALYSERLGKEMGFYTDPYQEFGRLSMEAWRASRLVVDTGIHAMGWSRQKAIDYMRQHTALSEHNIVAEIDRYIGWPGQALAYKVGELEIRKLRGEAEAALAGRFDLRSFHDQVLRSGSIPLPLLRNRINAWVTTQTSVAGDAKADTLVVAGPSQPDPDEHAESPLHSPFGMALDDQGHAIVVEYDGGRILRSTQPLLPLDEFSGEWKPIAGHAAAGFADGVGTEARFNQLHNLTRVHDGTFLLSDHQNHRVRRIDPRDGTVSTVVGSGKRGFSNGTESPGTIEFRQPICVESVHDGHAVLIADIGNRRIRRLDLRTMRIETVAGNGDKGVPQDGSIAANSPLVDPRAAVMDSKGRIYIAERGGHALRRVERDGTIQTLITGGKAGHIDGGPEVALLNGPKHLALDSDQRVWIADDVNHAVRCYDPATALTRTLDLGDFRLNRPHGLLIAGDTLFICDSFHDRILAVHDPGSRLSIMTPTKNRSDP